MRRSPYLLTPAILVVLVAIGARSSLHAGPLFPTEVYLTGMGSNHQAVADVDGDGHSDLVVVNGLSNDLSVLLGHGDATFTNGARPTVGSSPVWVAAADLNQDGHVDLAVANSGSGDISILLGRGGGIFDSESRIPVGSGPVTVLAADFNRDGRPDLLVVNQDSDDVRVLMGRGDGSFDPRPGTAVGDGPIGAVVADLNQDGALDFAVAISNPRNVKIYLGNAGDSFTLATTYALAGAPLALRVADLSGDGRTDLLVAIHRSSGQDPYQMVVLRSNGGGQFQALAPESLLGGMNGLDIGDVNGDDRLDVVKESYTSRGRVLVIEGKGDATFKLPRFIEGALFTSSAGLADFNGDAILDLIEVSSGEPFNQGFGRVAVLPGRGDGSFSSMAISAAGDYSNYYLATGEFNADGVPDVVMTNGGCCYADPYSGTATVFPGRMDGSLGAGVDYPVFAGGHMTTGDFNTDGRTDLALTSGSDVALLLGLGDGSFVNAGRLTSPGESKRVAAADLNGDGFLDLVKTGWFPDGLWVFLGRGDGQFLPPIGAAVGEVPLSVDAGDFDSDGRTDLAVIQRTDPGAVHILLGRGDGTFTQGVNLALPRYSSEVVVADFNEDGRADLAVTWSDPDFNQSPGHIAVFPGHGDGDFGDPLMFEIGSVPLALATADLNADGHLDLVAGNQASYDVSLIYGRGDGTFSPEDRIGTGATATPRDVAVADLNSDRRPDLIVCLYDLGVAVILNTGAFPDTDLDGTVDSEDDCTDSDGDGFSDPGVVRMVCSPDNCPTVFNPGQEDSNGDGAGDACQPTVVIEEIREDGGVELEVRAEVSDPQGETVRGTFELIERGGDSFVLRDPGDFSLYGCDSGLSPDGAGPGIAFINVSAGGPVLFDLDGFFGCEDGRVDFEMAPGPCGTSAGSRFSTNPILLNESGPTSGVCLRRAGTQSPAWNWELLRVTSTTLEGRQTIGSPTMRIPYVSALPSGAALFGLVDGRSYTMRISALDGETPPVFATAVFTYHGESVLRFIGAEPPVARISVPSDTECAEEGGAWIVLDGSSSTGSGGSDIAEFTWVEDPGEPSEHVLASGPIASVHFLLGGHRIGLRIKDDADRETSAESAVTVHDSVAPVLDCPAPATIECMGHQGALVVLKASASDACSGDVTVVNSQTSGGADASGSFPVGSTNVSFEATDPSGNAARCSTVVSVKDTQPPTLSLAAGPAALWPPNHEMVPVNVEWNVRDMCDPSTAVGLVSVSSSETDDAPGPGDGDTTDDVTGADPGTPDGEIHLRAERDGKGSGRVYELTYRAVDGSGNEGTAFAVVTVPHDKGNGPEPLLMRLESAGTAQGARIYWSAVPNAVGYDVISGDLSQLHVVDRHLSLGAVRVLSRGTTATEMTEGAAAVNPAVGRAFFYLIQARTGNGGTGFSTESAPWPRLPASCAGGCP